MPVRDVVLALLVPCCFGIGFVLAKPAIAHFPPMFLLLLIYIGNLVLVGALWRAPSLTGHLVAALTALTGVTLQGLLIFYGYREISASLATLIVQVQVPIGLLLGWMLCGEQLSTRAVTGVLTAFAGVAMIVGLPDVMPPLVPVLLIIVGSLAWAMGQVIARKYGRDNGMILLRAISIHAIPQLLLATVLFESGQIDSVRTASLSQWSAAGAFGFLGFFCGYSLWYSLIRRHPVSSLMPFMLLMPVVGVAAAIVGLGETLTVANVIGGATIIGGMAIAVAPRLSPQPA